MIPISWRAYLAGPALLLAVTTLLLPAGVRAQDGSSISGLIQRATELAAFQGGNTFANRAKEARAAAAVVAKKANLATWCFTKVAPTALGVTFEENGKTQVRIAKKPQYQARLAKVIGETVLTLDACVYKDRNLVTIQHEVHRVLSWSDDKIYTWGKGWVINILDHDPKYQFPGTPRNQMMKVLWATCRKLALG